MTAVVIATGLCEDALSLDPRHVSGKDTVGRREIERLLGRGRSFGQGPLARFLRAVAGSREESVALLTIVQPTDGDDPAAEVVEPLRDAVRSGAVLAADGDALPWTNLEETLSRIAGFESPAGRTETPILVVGTHTEGRVQTLANLLREVAGLTRVAVCSHLCGSDTQEGHDAALQHGLPRIGVRSLLSLADAARHVGIDPEIVDCQAETPCAIGPDELAEALDDERRRIIEGLCIRWTRTEARPLQGGYSGSMLLLADGFQGEARTEPLVLKIDSFAQMRREIDGYHRVKDLLGKHVPAFGFPVAGGEHIGVSMELAAMEGRPQTLQDTFEEAESDRQFELFLRRFEKTLDLLARRLYGNTRRSEWVVPYREFWLHTDKQQDWLRMNGNVILGYIDECGVDVGPRADVDELANMLRIVSGNDDGLHTDVCLVHGDLNLAWFIDWTHCGWSPLELDLAKIENDLKFVASKEFDFEDLTRLRALQEYLLSHPVPAEVASLPDTLRFVKWDLRYRKVLEAIRRVRQTYFSLKSDESWLMYRIALLRYSLHTLSFDKLRGRGEVDPPQLAHALFATESLLYDLISDDFHMRIRGERPESYPPRQRIHIDQSSWLLDCEEYDPPYYVAPEVLAQDASSVEGGWADPEEVSAADLDAIADSSRWKDDVGRPLHPRGRTGLAGRGLLGRWGPNHAVTAIVTRRETSDAALEILLARRDVDGDPELPAAFFAPGEDIYDALDTMLRTETGWPDSTGDAEQVFDGDVYDARQTDHAWVHSQAMLIHREESAVPEGLAPGGAFEELLWQPLDAAAINAVPPAQAGQIRAAIGVMAGHGHLSPAASAELLERTG
jgi:ADP-ribose pyrophosphatase